MHSIFKKFVINNLHLYREQIFNSNNNIMTSNRNKLAIIIEPRYCKYIIFYFNIIYYNQYSNFLIYNLL
jgi:hypothetical protein